MPKPAKILLLVFLILLSLVSAFLLLLPQIVPKALPLLIERQTGYQAQIKEAHLSLGEPRVVLRQITLARGKEIAASIQEFVFTGKWGNPLKGPLFIPLTLMVRGVRGSFSPTGRQTSGPLPLQLLLNRLFQFQRLYLEAPELILPIKGGRAVLSSLRLRLDAVSGPRDQEERQIDGSVDLSLSSDAQNIGPWQIKGRFLVKGTILKTGELRGLLGLKEVSFSSPRLKTRNVRGELAVILTPKLIKLESKHFDSAEIRVQTLPHQVIPLHLSLGLLQASLSLEPPHELQGRVQMELDGLMSLQVLLEKDKSASWRGNFQAEIQELKRLVSHPLVQERLEEAGLKGMSMAGKASLKGSMELKHLNGQPLVTWQAVSSLRKVNILVRKPYGAAKMILEGRVQASGRGRNFHLKSEVTLNQGSFQNQNISFQRARGKLSLAGDQNTLRLEKTLLFLPRLSFKKGTFHQVFNDLHVRGSGSWNFAARNISRASLLLELGEVGPVELKISSLFPLSLTAKARKLPLAKVLKLVKPVSAHMEGWEVQGALGLDLGLKEHKAIRAKLTLSDLALTDPQSKYMGEGICGEVAFLGPLEGLRPKGGLRVVSRLDRGEALLGNFYMNLGQTPLTFELATRLLPQGLMVEKGRVALHSGFEVRFSSLNRRLLPLAIEGQVNDLGSFFRTFIQESLEEAYPALDKIRMNGQAAWKLKLEPGELSGRLRLERVDLEKEPSFLLSHLSLDVPFQIPRDHKVRAETGTHKGKLQFELLETARFAIKNQEITLNLNRGRYLLSPLRFPLGGGIVVINRGLVEHAFSTSPKISLEVSLRDIKIQDLKLLPPPYMLKGTVNAENLVLWMDKEQMKSKGRIIIDLFGGRAIVSGLAMEKPFSPFRKFLCNLEFQNLDLEQLTRSLSFGLMKGRINGYIKNLVISNGQPEAFELLVKSIKVKGVPRRVSFSAVNDIQLISSGAESRTGLPLGMDRFIGELPYDRIGIKCILKNDAFKINGLIEKKGKEYFISRRGPWGIDVVNANPDNEISFKDMMERVKRVAEKRKVEIR